jgi:hypothetical protein
MGNSLGVNTGSQELNRGRRLAYETFRSTLLDLFGRNGVTELRFRDEWLTRLNAQPDLTLSGWYEPPPFGMAVLSGRDDSEVPFGFASLRPSTYWPSERIIDWNRGLIYAYCSPIHLMDRLPADFGVTLYFGKNRDVRRHFATGLSLTREIMREITPRTMSRSLFRQSETLFRKVGMRNNVASITDSVPVDLGHSLPLLDPTDLDSGRQLPDSTKRALRERRWFISESADWKVSSVVQFTIEPSLVSLTNPQLPQVSPHYVVGVSAARVIICDECDALYNELGLFG